MPGSYNSACGKSLQVLMDVKSHVCGIFDGHVNLLPVNNWYEKGDLTNEKMNRI